MIRPLRLLTALSLALLALQPAGAAEDGAGEKTKTARPRSPIQPPKFEEPGLSEAQKARFEKFLPNTFAKLLKHEPVTLALLGDETAGGYLPENEASYDLLQTWPGEVARRLALDFYYPGGVWNLFPKKGRPARTIGTRGNAIQLHDLTINGGTILQALGPLSSEAWDQRPGCLVVAFGANDALAGVPVETFSKTAEIIIAAARQRRADVFFVGPALLAGTENERARLALTRPYAAALREVAARNSVLFFDPAPAFLGTPAEGEPSFARAFAAIRACYDHGPKVQDFLHPNLATQQRLGGQLAAFLFENEGTGTLGLAAQGTAEAAALKTRLTFTNASDRKRTGLLCFLPAPGWTVAADAQDQPFRVDPNGSQEFTPTLTRLSGAAFSDDFWLTALVAGKNYSRLLEAPLLASPLRFHWPEGSLEVLGDDMLVSPTLTNRSGKPVDGTCEAVWNGQKSKTTFSLPAGEPQSLPLHFQLPAMGGPGSPARITAPVVVDLTVGAQRYQFMRNIEASRHLALKQITPLTPGGKTAGQVSLRAEADKDWLWLVFELSKVTPGNATLQLEIDARAQGERGTLGCVSPLTITLPDQDGPGRIGKFRPAQFGETYDRTLSPFFARAQLAARPGGDWRLTVTFPRSFFYRHEWMTGTMSTLGFNATLTTANQERFSFVDSPAPDRDPRALGVIELTDKPSSRWTARTWPEAGQ